MRSWLFPIITYAFLSVMLAFTGCKKISSVNGTVSSYTEAKTIAGVTVNTMTTLSYDGQGRLIMMATTNDTPTSYAYAANTVIKTQGASVVVYNLNDQGSVTSDNQNNVYSYNNGYCIEIQNTQTATSIVNVISSGNIISTATTMNAGTGNASKTIDDFQYGNFVDYRNYGHPYWGKQNTNLPFSASITDSITTYYSYSYAFDSQGRVIVETILNGPNSDIYTYTYVTN